MRTNQNTFGISRNRFAVLASIVTFASMTLSSCVFSINSNGDTTTDSVTTTIKDVDIIIDGVGHPELKSMEEVEEYLKEHNLIKKECYKSSSSTSKSFSFTLGSHTKVDATDSIKETINITTAPAPEEDQMTEED